MVYKLISFIFIFFCLKTMVLNLNGILQDCKYEDGIYTKDLTLVDKDLSNVVILDNSPAAYKHFTGKIY